MDQLTFRLPNVVQEKGGQRDFEGPLSLILQLLSRNKVEIRDIRVAEILDQYLAYLAEMERLDLEIAGEFITMASYLIYIKAKTLLEGTRDVEEMEQLISSLEEQQRKETLERMRAAAVRLSEDSRKGEGLFVRLPTPPEGPPEYTYAHEASALVRALVSMAGRERAAQTPLRIPVPAAFVYSVQDKTEEILTALRDSGSISLKKAVCGGRSEMTAAFLAILELYREERISLLETEEGPVITGFTEEENHGDGTN